MSKKEILLNININDSKINLSKGSYSYCVEIIKEDLKQEFLFDEEDRAILFFKKQEGNFIKGWPILTIQKSRT